MSVTVRRRWLRWSGAVATLAGLLAGSAIVAPTPAQAHPVLGREVHCIPPSFIHAHALDPSGDWLWGWEFVSATPIVLKSEGRFVDNHTDFPQSVTFTSQESHTFTLSTTHSETRTQTTTIIEGLQRQQQIGVSQTVTDSTTTQIGISVTATAPPRTSVQGDYGVRAFRVGFVFRVYHRGGGFFDTQRPCVLQGQTGLLEMTVPTSDHGWATSNIPLGPAVTFHQPV
jgi:hypothetical protein